MDRHKRVWDSFSEKMVSPEQEFLDGVITNAVESGGHGLYWCDVTSYGWSGVPSFATIAVDPDGEDWEALPGAVMREGDYLIDRLGIQKAIEMMQRIPADTLCVHPSYVTRILGAWYECDAGEIDATDSDIICQIAILGKVIFG